ncbi:DsbD_2 domain-containing protein [Candidatus Hydrogenisulfobacillus filiaventi]|uniref:DsbD_2 domain-containing protein n=1 Tax=Candidatus Hydrogenisulfobacillus filiaventi TaxID=2707344 RepID=A0A6F8ZIX6_9FIRM|nr:sulfite exporter TauE/SafE family protein [Bacillota bacterium]CAB1129892.1 DsbD_2 domain-containing protein [Candidatus Hydrogenisulfobacillus filiaventi]
MVNLWNPAAGMAVGPTLLTAFLLGVVHGITPDEHTWPITFSYAIGSYSTRGGLKSGLLFSLAFTVQRAIASELAYLSLARFLTRPGVDAVVYVLVGAAMAWAGSYALHHRHALHLHLFHRREHAAGPDNDLENWAPRARAPRPAMALLHGFIAGWGVGAFATILYTVLAPSMPGPAWGWAPGAAFGLGTTAVQAAAGAAFGAASRQLHLSPDQAANVAFTTSGRTLWWGGWAFVVAGILGLIFPPVMQAGITTGLHIHNLHTLGIGFVLVMVTVLGVGVGSLVREVRRAARANRLPAPVGPPRPHLP